MFSFKTLFKLAESGSDLWFDNSGERSPFGDNTFARLHGTPVVVNFPPKISRRHPASLKFARWGSPAVRISSAGSQAQSNRTLIIISVLIDADFPARLIL